MESYYIVFQCPECSQSMTIIDIDAFVCKKHFAFALADIRESIQITNERGKTQLQKAGATIYRLMPTDFSFANDVIIQNSDATDPATGPAEEICVVARKKRIVLSSRDKKQQVEIFRGSHFSKKKFRLRRSKMRKFL